jgi:hypothetical protein
LQGELSRQQDISGARASGHFFKLAAAGSLNASLAKREHQRKTIWLNKKIQGTPVEWVDYVSHFGTLISSTQRITTPTNIAWPKCFAYEHTLSF